METADSSGKEADTYPPDYTASDPRRQYSFVFIYELIGSSSPYESNRASPTGGRRPLPFKRDLMGLSLSVSLSFLYVKENLCGGAGYHS
jgi:hypothetical protein